jgi:DNA-binding CsgD family transcriptional regulator
VADLLEFDGEFYRPLFADTIPPQTGPERQALRSSMLDEGRALVALMLDGEGDGTAQHPYGLIDGASRMSVAIELKLGPDALFFDTLPGRSWAGKVRVALNLLLARRHLDAQQRQHVVAELKAGGLSNRRIAASVGVDEKTVRNDLRGGAEKSAVERTTGKDGRSRPRSMPTEEQLDERQGRVCDLLNGGLTIAQVAAELGVSSGTVVRDRDQAQFERDAAAEDAAERARVPTLAQALKGGSRLGAACPVVCPLCAATFRLGDATRGKKSDVAPGT